MTWPPNRRAARHLAAEILLERREGIEVNSEGRVLRRGKENRRHVLLICCLALFILEKVGEIDAELLAPELDKLRSDKGYLREHRHCELLMIMHGSDILRRFPVIRQRYAPASPPSTGDSGNT